MNAPRSPLLIVLSAPSGGGKTTLCQQLLQRHPEMTRAITCTTRSPRDGEKDGVDYYFLTPAQFAARVEANDFLEHAIVYGQSYGTPKSEVLNKLRQGKDVLLTIDVQGAATVCRQAAADPELKRELVTVFLTPASMKVLEERLRRRGANAADDLQRRLEVARSEIAQQGNFQHLITSASVAEDVHAMEAILASERLQRAGLS